MKVRKLDDFLSHSFTSSSTGNKKNMVIYSLSVHPLLSSKLATGGQDFKVRIWDASDLMSPTSSNINNNNLMILDNDGEDENNGGNSRRLLSTLSMHEGAVLCVRWQPYSSRRMDVDGNEDPSQFMEDVLLASGGDDGKVVIWALSSQNNSNAYTSVGKNTTILGGGGGRELYRPLRVLTGHTSDVSCLAWNSDGTKLASGSFDGQIYIYDADFSSTSSGSSSFDRIGRLDMAGVLVKGIAWDPAGVYIAVQGEERKFRMFRTSDWKENGVSEEGVGVFTGSGGGAAEVTFFSRLSWAPDGSALALCGIENQGICVCPVISRSESTSTSTPATEAGKEVSASSQSSSLNEAANLFPEIICLVGHDAPIEVATFNPLLYHSLEEEDDTCIIALASQDTGISIWSTTSQRALVTLQSLFTHTVLDLGWSHDGSRLYGCSYDGSVVCVEFADGELGVVGGIGEVDARLNKYGKGKVTVIPESLEILQMEESCKIKQALSQKSLLEERLMGKDGGGEVRMCFGSSNSSPSKFHPTIPQPSVSSQNHVFTAPLPISTISQPQPPPQLMPSPLQPQQSTLERQATTSTRDGKKRITPVLVQTGQAVMMGSGGPSPVKRVQVRSGVASAATGVTAGAGGTPLGGGVTYTLPIIQPVPSLTGVTSLLTIPTLRASFSVLLPKSGRNIANGEPEIQIGGFDTLQVKNSKSTGFQLSAMKSNLSLWTTNYIKSMALLSVLLPGPGGTGARLGSKSLIILGCLDGTLHVFSLSGRRLLVPCKMTAPPSFITAGPTAQTSSLLLYVDTLGSITLLDFTIPSSPKNVYLNRSVTVIPLLDLSIISIFIEGGNNNNSDGGGRIVCKTAKGSSGASDGGNGGGGRFMYNSGMGCWMDIGSGSASLSRTSAIGGGSIGTKTMPKLEEIEMFLASAMQQEEEVEELSYMLDNNLGSDEEEDDDDDLVGGPNNTRKSGVGGSVMYWLKIYARRLADGNYLAKAQELCEELYDKSRSGHGRGVHNNSNNNGRRIKMKERRSRNLLNAILPILVTGNRAFQRFLIDYKEEVEEDLAELDSMN